MMSGKYGSSVVRKAARFWGSMKLRNKFALAGIFIVLISISLLTCTFLQYETSQITETEYSGAQDLSLQVSNYFDEKYRSILQRVFTLQANDAFSKDSNSYLTRYLAGGDSCYYASALSQISGAFSELRLSEPYISSLYFYTPNGDFYDLAMRRVPNVNFQETSLYREILAQGDFGVLWAQGRTDELYMEHDDVIPVVMPWNVAGYGDTCYIVVQLKVQEIVDYLASVYTKGQGNVAILTDCGELAAGYFKDADQSLVSSQTLLNQVLNSDSGALTLSTGNGRYIAAYCRMQSAPFRVVLLKSQKDLADSLQEVTNYTMLVALLSAALCILAAVFVSRSITRPLAAMEDSLRKVSARDFNTVFPCRYDDEVGRLGKSFNFMLGETRNLIGQLSSTIQSLNEEQEKVKEEQALKRKAELTALQAQINPHFLYNTLNSITWMAESAGAEEIGLMAAWLGKMYQIGLSDGRTFITFREELEHVGSYLSIQKIRYGEKLSYQVHFDDGILDCMTLKLVLQPFVENAICHGIKETDRNGLITIRGRLCRNSRDIEIFIFDDGAGMERRKLLLMNRSLADRCREDDGGYGIYNINERIRLYFGDRYGVRIAGRQGRGTVVKLLVPALDSEAADRLC